MDEEARVLVLVVWKDLDLRLVMVCGGRSGVDEMEIFIAFIQYLPGKKRTQCIPCTFMPCRKSKGSSGMGLGM